MWILISNMLDIDFIYGDIHGRLYKKDQQNMTEFFSHPTINIKNPLPEMNITGIYN